MPKKKYQLGALEVTDSKQMERDEIIIEMIDRMQKYVVEAERGANNRLLSLEERYECVKHTCSCFCGLSNFLNETLGIDLRNPASGTLYTQDMFNRIYYHETMLKVEIAKKTKAAV